MVRWSVRIGLVVWLSLLAVGPAAAARRVELEVVFLVDTSDSMADELSALCGELDGVLAEADRRGVAVNAVVLGVAETRACARQRLADRIAEGQTEGAEDWGLAVLDLVRHYPWTSDAARLVIPLSDEGPLQGDPVDDDDARVAWMAIREAQAGEVVVSPVLGTDFGAGVESLARDLAQETGGRLFASRNPDEDLAEGVRDLILAAAERVRARATVLESIPTPRDAAWEGPVLGTNLVLALLLTLVVGVAATILDDVLGGDRAGERTGRLGRLAAAAVNLGRAGEHVFSPGEWSRLSGRPRRLLIVLQLGLFLALMAFVSLWLGPGLSPLSWRGLGMGLGVLLALLLVNLIHDGGRYWLARRSGAEPTLRLRPGAPLATLVGVLLSRTFGFAPGFFYARATHCVFPSDRAEAAASPRWPARVAWFGLGAVGAAGLLFWGLTIPTSLLLEFVEGLDLAATLASILTGLVGALQGFFALCFFLAWQTLLFELLPLASTGGGVVYRRSRLLWSALAFVVLWVLLQGLVNPFGTPGELLENGGLVLLLLATLLYSALAVGVWLWVAVRAGGDLVPDREQDQRTAVLAVSLVVLWALGGCLGLTMLVARWLG